MNRFSKPLVLPNGVRLRNRIVKSAMSEALADANNDPTAALINLFAMWGTGGAAMLITGNMSIDRAHLEHAGNVVLDANSDLGRLSDLAAAGQSGGAKLLAQLSHSGRQTREAINPHPTSISDVQLAYPGYGKPVPASEGDLVEIIAHFALSAKVAEEAGFDGVEIHAAHGYLLSSSLSPRINTRKDRWGGSLENRSRLLTEVVRAVRSAVDPGFIVGVKLNSSDFQKGGFDHGESAQVAVMLEAEGVEYIEISGGNYESPAAYRYSSQKQSTAVREAYFLEYAAEIRRALNIPLMVTGGFRSASVINGAIESGKADLIGMGRPFIIDFGFAAKLLSGTIDGAPAIEREFPPAETLPPGAALEWFCAQLAILGHTGETDMSLSIVEGQEKYVKQINLATERLIATGRR